MSMIDVLIRVDAICKKYDKYDADKHRNGAAGGDPFSRLYTAVDADIDAAIEVDRSSLLDRRIPTTLGSRILKMWIEIPEIREGRDGDEPGGGGGAQRRCAAHQGAAHGGGRQAPEARRQEGDRNWSIILIISILHCPSVTKLNVNLIKSKNWWWCWWKSGDAWTCIHAGERALAGGGGAAGRHGLGIAG